MECPRDLVPQLRLVVRPRLDERYAQALAQRAEDRVGTGRSVSLPEAAEMLRAARRIARGRG